MSNILCGIDIETTGLDFEKNHITEIAWVIKEHRDARAYVERSFFLNYANFVLTDEITQITKIEQKHLRHGKTLEYVLGELEDDLRTFGVNYVVAHNGNNFDKPFIERQMNFYSTIYYEKLLELPWLDTKEDIVYPSDIRHTNLIYVAASLGFLNPFPHAALSDVKTMLKVLDSFELTPVIERSFSPSIVLRAMVSYDDREKAKKLAFSWEKIEDKTYPKAWVKKVKLCDFDEFIKKCDFEITKVD